MMKHILLAPLDWGLGHTTRCIPLIRQWRAEGNAVVCACTGPQKALLQREFPDMHFFEDIPQYNIKYSRDTLFAWTIARQLPRLIRVIRDEHRWINRLLKHHSFDLIISDNRYGFWSKKVQSIFITHQLFPIVPKWTRMTAHGIVRRYIKRFHSCWVPDFPDGINLSGALSHGVHSMNVEFIGPLSRFAKRDYTTLPTSGIVALISGPEPQRTVLEEEIIRVCREKKWPLTVICGLPHETFDETHEGIRRISHADDASLAKWITESSLLICRSGYSTIMDLQALQHERVLFVPTPGQTEQEYLAKWHATCFNTRWCAQSAIAEALSSDPRILH